MTAIKTGIPFNYYIVTFGDKKIVWLESEFFNNVDVNRDMILYSL